MDLRPTHPLQGFLPGKDMTSLLEVVALGTVPGLTCTLGGTPKEESQEMSIDMGGLCRQPHQRHGLHLGCVSLTTVHDLPHHSQDGNTAVSL